MPVSRRSDSFLALPVFTRLRQSFSYSCTLPPLILCYSERKLMDHVVSRTEFSISCFQKNWEGVFFLLIIIIIILKHFQDLAAPFPTESPCREGARSSGPWVRRGAQVPLWLLQASLYTSAHWECLPLSSLPEGKLPSSAKWDGLHSMMLELRVWLRGKILLSLL